MKEFDEMPNHWVSDMKKWMGKIVTFKNFYCNNKIKIYEDIINENNNYGWFWRESDFQIVFDTWEDVRNAMEEECDKHGLCDGCRLYDKEKIHHCYDFYFRNKDYNKLIIIN